MARKRSRAEGAKGTLVSWIGSNDLGAVDPARARHKGSIGPLAKTLDAGSFSQVCLLYNYDETEVRPYLSWLAERVDVPVQADYCSLTSPIHFGDIHDAAVAVLSSVQRQWPGSPLNILISPGTPAMQAVWILLGKTRFPATFFQSTEEQGVQQVEIPFDIVADYVPSGASVKSLADLAAGAVSVHSAFADIFTRDPEMERLKARASALARTDVPVLIMGETGTGKELFATAIHNASQRKSGPLVTVNCGAVPPELIDSHFFGHRKGAFTGAVNDHEGRFEAAHGGTLFLDEFGEMELSAQVRLLRALQSGEITRVGDSVSRRVDVRLIAATNRDLLSDVATGRFREDLFYRVAVGILNLPPLRNRRADLLPLAERLLEGICQGPLADMAQRPSGLGAEAIRVIRRHSWPGNVRELHAVLLRAALWAGSGRLSGRDIREALFSSTERHADVLGRELGDGIDLPELLSEVVRHYVPRALSQSGGNRSHAARLLGLKSYQVLDKWAVRHGVDGVNTPPEE